MTGSVRRVAVFAATLSLLAMIALGTTSVAFAGITVGSASVTIVKATDPAIDPQDFEFTLNGAPFGDITLDTDPTSVDVEGSRTFLLGEESFGDLYITEQSESDWTLVDIQCTGDADVSYNVAAHNVLVDVDNGEIIVCTFYNTKRAQLEVRKVTVPGSDPQDFSFSLTGDAVPATLELDTDPGSMFTGSSLAWSVVPDDLGAYTITEGSVAGWTLTNLACIGAGDDSSVDLGTRTATLDIDAGELVLCTFTNTSDAEITPAPPSDAPSDAPTDEPPTEPAFSGDEGGVTDAATVPETSTEGTAAQPGSAVGLGVAIIALLLLSGALVITRPKRAR